MNGTELVQQIGGILVSGIQAVGSGIATGAKAMVTALFLDTSGSTTTLSSFGTITAVFGAIALAVGITTLLFNWIKSLGK